ncbi:MAG: type III-B CRISPR module-associated protein Cmr5 [Firmicutes bacterium]|nr:type III-B CRISPR module-associated protein Cmr5 [Bacillota bacterium]
MDRTLAQRRARWALEQVQAVQDLAYAGEFKAHAAELPALIHMAGLGQTAAFYAAKAGPARSLGGGNPDAKAGGREQAYGRLYQALSGWLTGPGMPLGGRKDLLEGITAVDQERYRWAQAEAQALAVWIARLAKALIAKEAEA